MLGLILTTTVDSLIQAATSSFYSYRNTLKQ